MSQSVDVKPETDITMFQNADFECINGEARQPGVRRKYCPHEVTALVMGVQRYADDSCPWSSILNDPELGFQFHGRTGVDLKDKWRTLTKNRPELNSYTENRRKMRQYRPFTQVEEQALLEGVRIYQGQRNIWSLILEDERLGPRFSNRSNVQLKDKFRTMRRAGQFVGPASGKTWKSPQKPKSKASPTKRQPIVKKTAATKKNSPAKANATSRRYNTVKRDTKKTIVVCNV